MEKTRYKNLMKRSFDLLLRYKIYKQYKIYIGLKKDKNISIIEKLWDDFDVSDDDKKEFAKLYIKGERETLKKVNIFSKDFIEKNKEGIKNYKKLYTAYFENRMSLKDFEKFWSTKELRFCGYCGINEEQIKELNDEKNKIYTKRLYSRGKTMEIDKKDPNGEYEKENIILSCYWCNNAKTDEFDLCEFEKIARGIHAVWEKRLSDSVKFPNETYIK